MGIRSGGVLTVSKVGVSAVTYMPYNGYSDKSVVTVSTVHRHTHPRLHVRTATLLNLPRSAQRTSFYAVASCGLLPRTTRPAPRVVPALLSVPFPHSVSA